MLTHPLQTSLQQMQDDIITTAELVNAPYNVEQITRVLSVFAQHFATAPVEFRTNNKPVGQRSVSYRYVDLELPHDPLQMAIEGGLIDSDELPEASLLKALQSRFETLGWGVDAGAEYGMEKIWQFFSYRYPTTDVYNMPTMPAAVKKTQAFHAEFGLDTFSIIASDFRHQTMNIYFPFPQALQGEAPYTVDDVSRMLTTFGAQLPTSDILDVIRFTPIVNLTYRWDSDEMERLCFYLPAPTLHHLPEHGDPVLDTFVQGAPFLTDQQAFIMGYTFSKKGMYLKMENDYGGRILSMFQAAVSVPPFTEA